MALARAAGERQILHDVSKLAPIGLGEVAVTSAGKLPAEFIFHGASVGISETDIRWSEQSIYNTVRNALVRSVALGVDVLFIPLLAAGTGRAPPELSASQILKAICEFESLNGIGNVPMGSMRINIVVYQETELPRQAYDAELNARIQARTAQIRA